MSSLLDQTSLTNPSSWSGAIHALSDHWTLSDIIPITITRWSCVAQVKRDQQPLILEIIATVDEATQSLQALHQMRGTIDVVDACLDHHGLLLQPAVPGIALSTQPHAICLDTYPHSSPDSQATGDQLQL